MGACLYCECDPCLLEIKGSCKVLAQENEMTKKVVTGCFYYDKLNERIEGKYGFTREGKPFDKTLGKARLSIQCRSCGRYGIEGHPCLSCPPTGGQVAWHFAEGPDDPYLGGNRRILSAMRCVVFNENSKKSDTPELDKKEGFHGHPKFYELLDQMAKLHSRKNHDYSGDDPLSNLKASEEIGIPAWKGILIRLMDKWGRLRQFAKTETLEVKDESVIDTLMDNAVYSLLCIILYEEERENATETNPN